MSASENLKRKAAMDAYEYLCKDPENNLPALLNKLIKLDPAGLALKKQATDLLNNYNRPNSPAKDLILSFFTEVNDRIREKMYENIVINGTLIGSTARRKLAKQYGRAFPWLILIDATSACNLHCTGCWAADYGHEMNLTLDEMDNVVKQANELDCYLFLLSGGEPMVRKDDLFELCRRHPDCEFMMFTNGTLIDEKAADEIIEIGNLLPAISIEGYEEQTDFRRGKGTYQRVLKTMSILKEKKIPFGASCCYTRKTAELIGSDEYFDFLISQGAKWMWCFAYTPVGVDATTDLIITAEQREYMYHNIRRLRNEKPLLAMDFYNDAKYVDGCIAGGRVYLHINANGDYEPCAFIHYSDSNIRTDTLLEALQKPLFKTFDQNEPFNDNMLRPCPLVDNPGRLTLMVKVTDAHSTDMIAPEDPKSLSAKCIPLAKEWAPKSKVLWEKEKEEAEKKKHSS